MPVFSTVTACEALSVLCACVEKLSVDGLACAAE
jgi:hypothetical protein